LRVELEIKFYDSNFKRILSNKNANGWKLQIVVEHGVSFGEICMQN